MRNLDSTEPEKYVLSGILNNSKVFHSVACIISENDFYLEKHRMLFSAMRKLSDDGGLIEVGSVDAKLRLAGEINPFLDSSGKQSYLFELLENFPCYSGAEFYAKQVKDFSTLRQLQFLCQRTQGLISESASDAAEIMAKASEDIYKLRQGTEKKKAERAGDVLQRLLQDMQNGDAFRGLSTGFTGLDDITLGMRGGEMLVLAAKPGVGKTALALNIASNIAKSGKSVMFFNMEMRNTDLITRIVCSLAKINSGYFRQSYLAPADFAYLPTIYEQVSKFNLWVDDSSGITAGEIRQKCMEKKCGREGLDFVVVDYLQLIQLGKAENRTVAITDISWQLKNLAKDLDIPVLCLSQMNRQHEKDNERPGLHNLRDSGAIGQDADGVWFLVREDYEAKLLVVKNRQHKTGDVPLEFAGGHFLFTDRKPAPPPPGDGFFPV